MKIHRILDDYLHGQIKKSAGDWDDIANVPDIADSFTEDKYEPATPFNKDFWNNRIENKPKWEDLKKNNLDITI